MAASEPPQVISSPDDEEPPRRRLVHAAGPWLVAVLVVAGTNAAAIRAALPDDPPFHDLFPLTVGTTWVYAVTGHEDGATVMVRQVTGPGFVGLEPSHQTVVRDRFLGPEGEPVGRERVLALGQDGSELLLLSEREGSSFLSFEPPIPLYRLEAHTGEAWEWRASLEPGVGLQRAARIRLFGLEPVTVAGTHLTGCPHYERVIEGLGETEVHEEWLCPGIGPVLLRDRVGDVVTQSELVAFRSSEAGFGSAESLLTQSLPRAPADDVIDAARHVPQADLRLEGPARTEWVAGQPDFPPVAASGFVVLAGSRGSIHARNVTTGEIPWRLELDGGIAAPPGIAGELVVVLDIDRTLWGVELATGIARWATRLPEVVSAPPLVSAETIVVPLQDGTVRALRAADGSLAWSAPLAADFQPVLTGTRVVLADTPRTLTALELATGEPAWTANVPEITVPPSASEELVVGHTGTSVYAVQAATGHLRWSVTPRMEPSENTRTRAAVTPSAVVLHGRLGTVIALSPDDGSTLWRAGAAPSLEPPLVLGSEVVIADDGGIVRQFSLADGRETETWTPAIPARSGAVGLSYGDGTVFVTVQSHDRWSWAVFSFETEPPASAPVRFNGEVRRIPGFAQDPPVLTGDDALVITSDGVGSSLWRVPRVGGPLRLAKDDTEIPFAVPAGDLVITRLGTDVVALPGSGGAPVWRVPVGDPPFLSAGEGVGIPALSPAGNRLFVPTNDGRLLAVDTRSGATLWEHRPERLDSFADVPGAPDPFARPGVALALPDGDVVFGGDAIVRLDGNTGAVQWSLAGLMPENALALTDGVVVASGSLTEAEAIAPRWSVDGIDAATGRLRWRVDAGHTFLAPAAASGIVVTRRADGWTQGLEAVSGNPIWSFEPPTPIGPAALVVGDVVAVTSQGTFEERRADDQVALLDLATGRYLAAVQLYGGFAQLVGGAEGTLAITIHDELFLLRMARS